jgi:RNA processing factor Prp31
MLLFAIELDHQNLSKFCTILIIPGIMNVFLSFKAVELSEFKLKIFEYVESRMSFIAPNLSIIVGASIAAKLMGK